MKHAYAGTFYPFVQSNHVTANVHRLLSEVSISLKAKNDAALSRALGVKAPVISKLRHRSSPVTCSIMVRMSEATGLSIYKLREFLEGPIQEAA